MIFWMNQYKKLFDKYVHSFQCVRFSNAGDFTVKVDGCIVWNVHNTVFGWKRSAICALAVYFMHSTQPKIQGLVSRDSIVNRQFITAWVTE